MGLNICLLFVSSVLSGRTEKSVLNKVEIFVIAIESQKNQRCILVIISN